MLHVYDTGAPAARGTSNRSSSCGTTARPTSARRRCPSSVPRRGSASGGCRTTGRATAARPAPGRDIASAARDVAAVVDHLGVASFAVMGHRAGDTCAGIRSAARRPGARRREHLRGGAVRRIGPRLVRRHGAGWEASLRAAAAGRSRQGGARGSPAAAGATPVSSRRTRQPSPGRGAGSAPWSARRSRLDRPRSSTTTSPTCATGASTRPTWLPRPSSSTVAQTASCRRRTANGSRADPRRRTVAATRRRPHLRAAHGRGGPHLAGADRSRGMGG